MNTPMKTADHDARLNASATFAEAPYKMVVSEDQAADEAMRRMNMPYPIKIEDMSPKIK